MLVESRQDADHLHGDLDEVALADHRDGKQLLPDVRLEDPVIGQFLERVPPQGGALLLLLAWSFRLSEMTASGCFCVLLPEQG
jgi:hypothetical protein